MRDLQIFSNSFSAGRVAQSVEQRIENPRVDSSILSPATSIDKAHRDVGFFHYCVSVIYLQMRFSVKYQFAPIMNSQ